MENHLLLEMTSVENHSKQPPKIEIVLETESSSKNIEIVEQSEQISNDQLISIEQQCDAAKDTNGLTNSLKDIQEKIESICGKEEKSNSAIENMNFQIKIEQNDQMNFIEQSRLIQKEKLSGIFEQIQNEEIFETKSQLNCHSEKEEERQSDFLNIMKLEESRDEFQNYPLEQKLSSTLQSKDMNRQNDSIKQTEAINAPKSLNKSTESIEIEGESQFKEIANSFENEGLKEDNCINQMETLVINEGNIQTPESRKTIQNTKENLHQNQVKKVNTSTKLDEENNCINNENHSDQLINGTKLEQTDNNLIREQCQGELEINERRIENDIEIELDSNCKIDTFKLNEETINSNTQNKTFESIQNEGEKEKTFVESSLIQFEGLQIINTERIEDIFDMNILYDNQIDQIQSEKSKMENYPQMSLSTVKVLDLLNDLQILMRDEHDQRIRKEEIEDAFLTKKRKLNSEIESGSNLLTISTQLTGETECTYDKFKSRQSFEGTSIEQRSITIDVSETKVTAFEYEETAVSVDSRNSNNFQMLSECEKNVLNAVKNPSKPEKLKPKFGSFKRDLIDSITFHVLDDNFIEKKNQIIDMNVFNVKLFFYKVTWKKRRSGRVPLPCYFGYETLKTHASLQLLEYLETASLLPRLK